MGHLEKTFGPGHDHAIIYSNISALKNIFWIIIRFSLFFLHVYVVYQIWKPYKILIIAHEMHDGPLILPQIENATLQGKCTVHSNSALNSHTYYWMEFFSTVDKRKNLSKQTAKKIIKNKGWWYFVMIFFFFCNCCHTVFLHANNTAAT